MIVSSTPFGEHGFFADLFQKAASGELADAAAVHATTAEMNPTISAEFLEAEQARDPESYKSEYEALFIGSGGAFLDADSITDAVVDRGPLLPEQGTNWVAGLDPAFSRDPFGLALVGQDPADRGRLLLGHVGSWKPPATKATTFEERRQAEDRLLDEVSFVCRRYGARCVTDQYCAPQVLDRPSRAGISVTTIAMTGTSKTAAFSELRARLQSHTIELYHDVELLAELRRLRTKYTAGSAAVVNPRVGGSHGDRAQALALAVYEHDRHGLARTGQFQTIRGGPPAIARLDSLDKVSPSVARSPRTLRWYDRPSESIADKQF